MSHPASALPPGNYTETLSFSGLQRDYRLHVPPQAARQKVLPLVLNIHGFGSNAAEEEVYSGMDATADEHGFVVAYPDGTPSPPGQTGTLGWNAGGCCGTPQQQNVDDVQFLVDVVANVAAYTPVDLRRVYATGISNGGMMSYRLAIQATNHFAAIASVAGQVSVGQVNPSRPIPVLEFHSVNDPLAFYQGVNTKIASFMGVDQEMSMWTAADRCPKTPSTAPVVQGQAGSTNDGETLTIITYSPCADGTQVMLYKFTGSGHVWPGANIQVSFLGKATTLVNADDVIWQFFSKFSIPSSVPDRMLNGTTP